MGVIDSVELLHPSSTRSDSEAPARGALDADGVVLAGTVGHDAHWTRGWPRPALPLSTCTMIENLVDRLGGTLSGALALCVNGRAEWLGEQVQRLHPYGTKITLHRDAMPRGSAGCLRDCRDRLTGQAILAMGASVWLDDDPAWLLRRHREEGNALTLFCIRTPSLQTRGQLDVLRPTSLFCCEPSVLDFVRPSGFQDVKEQLVPALRRAGLRVGAVALRGNTCEVTDWESYMRVLAADLAVRGASRGAHQLVSEVYCGADVEIGNGARLVGPLSLGDRCRIGDHALLIGPLVLGDDCVVEEDARLIRVVAPVSARFAANASVTDVFVADQASARFPSRFDSSVAQVSAAEETRFSSDRCGEPQTDPSRDTLHGSRNAEPPSSGNTGLLPVRSGTSVNEMAQWIVPLLLLAGVFVWTFWDTVERLWGVWQGNPDYGVGQLVPLAAAYLCYARRAEFSGWTPQRWWPGVGIFLTGVASTWAGEWYAFPFVAYAGVVLSANGIIMSVLGRERWKTFLYPMLFLFLACPLPQRMHEAVMLPLQTLGASLASGSLELVGIPALRSGHVLEIGGRQVAVAEACSGLRMVMALIVVVAFVADLVRRPLWQRGILLLSAIPVALACNVARIVVASLLYYADLPWLAEGAFHDAAGLAMVPIALMMIVLELRWIDALTRRTKTPVILGSNARVVV